MATWKRSREMLAESRRYLAAGVSSGLRSTQRPTPLFIERGEGSRLIDVDGNSYIDYTLAYGPSILGHGNPAVAEAVARQARLGVTYGAQHRWEIELSRRITQLVPCAELVSFSSTGSEAVQAAMRLARAYTGRTKIVKFEGQYHGWMDTVLVSFRPSLDKAGPASHPVAVPGVPGMVEGAYGDLIILQWNDLEAVERTFAEHRDQIAAIMTEPIMCNTGVILPEPGYLEGLRSLCDEHGALLIFDEVITGFRVAIGGAQERLGVTPDLATFGKAVAGGLPLSVLAGRRRVMDLVDQGVVPHMGTFNGNPLCTAGAVASLAELTQDGGAPLRKAAGVASALAAGIRALGRKLGVPLLIHEAGPVFQVMLTTRSAVRNYREWLECDHDSYQALAERLAGKGVLVLDRGLWYVSTAHTQSDADETLAALEGALSTPAAADRR